MCVCSVLIFLLLILVLYYCGLEGTAFESTWLFKHNTPARDNACFCICEVECADLAKTKAQIKQKMNRKERAKKRKWVKSGDGDD